MSTGVRGAKSKSEADRARESQSKVIEAQNKELQELRHQQSIAGKGVDESVQKGKDFAKEVIGTGLGRLGTDKDVTGVLSQYASQAANLQNRAKQSADIRQVTDPAAQMGDIEARLRSVADQGLSSQESQMMREKAFEDANRSTQTASRRMQALLGSSGVKGATAGRQLLDIEAAGAQNKTNLSRDIFLQSEQVRRQGINDLAQFGISRGNLSNQSAQIGVNRDIAMENAANARLGMAGDALSQSANALAQVKTFDLSQLAKEKDIQMQSVAGFMQIGQADRAAALNSQAVARQNVSSGGGMSVICTELWRRGKVSTGIKNGVHFMSRKIDRNIYEGYLRWAIPVVKLMQRSRLFAYCVEKLAIPVMHHMIGNPTKFGKLMFKLGFGLSKLLRTR
jgi:hypothetical protein